MVSGTNRAHYIEIGPAPRTLGRGPGADIVLQDERASKVHCTVRVTPQGAVEVTDAGSRNGTFVDGAKVQTSVLQPNSQLRIGGTVLQVEHKDPAQVRALEETMQAAILDSLTGIPNRRGFIESASAAVSAATRHKFPLSCVFLDIDHFKQINDALGHAAGDAVLKETARRIDALRRTEDLFCRFGGEEFVLLLPYTALDQASTFTERLREAVASRPVDHYGKTIAVTFSAGIAAFAPGETIDQLLRRADQAMYRAKEKGRNRIEKDA